MVPIINFKEIITSSYILEESVSSILNDFLKQTKMKANQVFFSVPIPYVFSTNFLVPFIPENSLFNVIRFESQRQLPLSLDEIEFEYRYFPFETQDLKQWLIFIAAVSKNYLKKIKTISELTKLKLAGYGIEYFSFEPYFLGKIGNFLVIDLGHTHSTLTLISNQKVIYGNKIKIQGLDLLNSLMNLTQYPDEQVLELIQKRGFLFTPEEKEIQFLVESFLDNLAALTENEINRLENVFYLKIDKIFFTGGLSILPGFQEKILAKLAKYQQEILQPGEIVQGEKFSQLKEKATIFIPALGVILRKLMLK